MRSRSVANFPLDEPWISFIHGWNYRQLSDVASCQVTAKRFLCFSQLITRLILRLLGLMFVNERFPVIRVFEASIPCELFLRHSSQQRAWWSDVKTLPSFLHYKAVLSVLRLELLGPSFRNTGFLIHLLSEFLRFSRYCRRPSQLILSNGKIDSWFTLLVLVYHPGHLDKFSQTLKVSSVWNRLKWWEP